MSGRLFSFRVDTASCNERRGARGPRNDGAVTARDVEGRAAIVFGLRDGPATLDASDSWSSAIYGSPTREVERGEMGGSEPR